VVSCPVVLSSLCVCVCVRVRVRLRVRVCSACCLLQHTATYSIHIDRRKGF